MVTDISTHSLTRRLTERLDAYSPIQGISTHSLTRRLTGRNLWAGIPAGNFNSQPHKEADDFSYTDGPDAVISTHSLTRRLT